MRCSERNRRRSWRRVRYRPRVELAEETHVPLTLLGVLLIVLGVALLDRWSPRLRPGWTWTRGVSVRLAFAALAIAASVGATLLAVSLVHHLYGDRRNLPDLGARTDIARASARSSFASCR
jgi:hypothetical protein